MEEPTRTPETTSRKSVGKERVGRARLEIGVEGRRRFKEDRRLKIRVDIDRGVRVIVSMDLPWAEYLGV